MSSDGKIVVDYESRTGQLLRGQAEINKELEKTNKKVDELDRGVKKVGATQGQMQQSAVRAYREAGGELEKLRQKQLEWNVLLKQGHLDLETHQTLTARNSAEIKRLGDEGTLTFGKMMSGARGFGAAILGVTSLTAAATAAVRILGAEIDANAARQDRAAGHQLGLARPTRAMIRNLGSGSEFTGESAVARVKQIAASTGASQLAVMEGAGGVLSARGSFSESTSFDALEKTARMDPSLTGKDMSTVAGSALDIRKAFGGTNEQALGMLMVGQQTARVEDLQQYAQNVIPAVLGLSNEKYGLSAQEAFGLTSAFTLISGDKRGAESGTGSLRFAKQIVEATKQAGMMKGSFQERLQFLNEDPRGQKARTGLLGTLGAENAKNLRSLKHGQELTGEAATIPAMLGMLSPGSKEYAEFQAMMKATPTMGSAGDVYAGNLKNQASVGLLRVAQFDERMRARNEWVLSDPARGQAGVAINRLNEMRTNSGRSFAFEDSIRNKLTQIRLGDAQGSEGLELAEAEIRAEAERLGRGEYSGLARMNSYVGRLFPPAAPLIAAADTIGYAASPQDRRDQAELLDLANALKELNDTIKQNTEERRAVPAASPNGARPPLSQDEP